jgi:hypothetical protein
MKLPRHEYILALVETLALALLITRLLVSGLARFYKFFFSYLIFDLLDTLWPFVLPFNDLYGRVYMASQCIRLCFYVLIVYELSSLLLRDMKGIARLAKRYSAVALGIAILLSLLVVTALPHQRNILRKLFYVEIPIVSSLVLFMLLIAVFLAYYPVPLHRNALLYAIGYVVYFLSKTALMFMTNLHVGASLRAFSTAFLYVTLGCIAFWAIFLNRVGEQRAMALGRSWSPPEKKQQVLLRLREMNDSLLRARPK